MKVFFAGSPPFATAILEELLNSRHAVVGLLTPPDRPKGRGQRTLLSPLAELATKKGVEVIYTENANDPAIIDKVRASRAGVLVVASFGQLLKEELLNAAPKGALNVHASVLPRHRGASPIAFAMMEGDAETGVAIQRMVKKLDAGPIAGIVKTNILPRETAGELTERLSVLGARLLVNVLDQLETDAVVFEPQDERFVTYARKLKKEDGAIDWQQSAGAIARFIRAMTPWPGAQTALRLPQFPDEKGVRLRILDADAKENIAVEESPGSILGLPSDPQGKQPASLDVATSRGVLTIHRLLPEGGRALNSAEFLRGRRLTAGAKLLKE